MENPLMKKLNRIKKIRVGQLVREGECFLLDETALISEEDFEMILGYMEGMNLHTKVLDKKV